MKDTGRKWPRMAGLLLILLLSFSSCQLNFTLPFGPDEPSDDPAALMALLFLLGSNKSAASSSNECSNASGMVICVPGGLAQ